MVGRPVVAYDAVGMRSLLGDRADAVVPIDDHPALAAAIIKRLQDPDQCLREGIAGRERVLAEFATDVLLPRALDHTIELFRSHRGEVQ